MRRAVPLAATLLASALSALAQPAPAPKDDAIAQLELGFAGSVPGDAPAPVWLTVVNPSDRQVELRAVASSGDAKCERTLTLPAGARQRVCLTLRVHRRLLVRLLDGEDVIAERLLEQVPALEAGSLLVVDGRSPERVAPRVVDAPGFKHTVTVPELCPSEAVSYLEFGLVLLRQADPDRWTEAQRAAVVEHVALGGTVMITDVSPQRPKAQDFVDRIPTGPAQTIKAFGRPVQVRRVGFGRLFLVPDDLVTEIQTQGPLAAQLLQDLAGLIAQSAGGNSFAPLFQGDEEGTLPERPGFATKILLGLFVLLYLIAVGPALGIALRKASRRRLALAAATLIASFSLLAFVVAGAVRTGSGRAYVRQVLYVPETGPSLLLADIAVASGGATRYDLQLSGAEVALTSLPGGTSRDRSWNNGWKFEDVTPTSAETWRGRSPSLTASMSPWDGQWLTATGLVPGVSPLRAVLRLGRKGYELELTNTTGAPIRQAILVEDGVDLDFSTPFVDLGDIPAGEELTVPVLRGAAARTRIRDEKETWYRTLGVPSAWNTWSEVQPHPPSEAALRYRIVSRMDPRLRVSGDDLDTVEHSLRIDPVKVEGTLGHGYLGVVIEAGNRFTGPNGERHEEVVFGRIVAGSPAEKAGIVAGMRVSSVGKDTILSVEQFRAVMSRKLPGERVRLRCYDPKTSTSREVRVRLTTREGIRKQ